LILWRERLRFLPAVLAVGFSALLVALQTGVLLGTLSLTSAPIDAARAEVYVTSREALSFDLGYPIPENWIDRVLVDPDVTDVEPYLYGFEYWHKPSGGAVVCAVIGSRLEDDALGAVSGLTPELRALLREEGTVVVDESDLGRLGLTRGVGERAVIGTQPVRVVGVVSGLKSIGGPFVFCSLATGRRALSLFSMPGNEHRTMYYLARCRESAQPKAVAARLRAAHPDMGVVTAEEFSWRTRMYWLREAKAGIALLFTSALSALVGFIVTSQTLYAATAAALREYSLFRALGIPRWRIGSLILAQSLWVGVAGLALAVPLIAVLGQLIELTGGTVDLPAWLFLFAGGVTLIIAALSGLLALRSLRLFEPIALLR
jgi:putative ABC transport system permease protein